MARALLTGLGTSDLRGSCPAEGVRVARVLPGALQYIGGSRG